jgi:hypothetical protein
MADPALKAVASVVDVIWKSYLMYFSFEEILLDRKTFAALRSGFRI